VRVSVARCLALFVKESARGPSQKRKCYLWKESTYACIGKCLTRNQPKEPFKGRSYVAALPSERKKELSPPTAPKYDLKQGKYRSSAYCKCNSKLELCHGLEEGQRRLIGGTQREVLGE